MFFKYISQIERCQIEKVPEGILSMALLLGICSFTTSMILHHTIQSNTIVSAPGLCYGGNEILACFSEFINVVVVIISYGMLRSQQKISTQIISTGYCEFSFDASSKLGRMQFSQMSASY